MDRRNFGKLLAAVAGAAATGDVHAGTVGPSRRQRPLIKPRALRPGDLVGLIAPSGVLDDATLQRGVSNLESLGFRVKLSANVRAARGGYAGTVAQRLDDLHGMFLDREVKAIWAARGGSGCSALLPGIQYGLIRSHPKILVGYSDITALHLAIHRHAGLVTFHGPVAPSTPTDYAVTQMQAVLMWPRPETEIQMSVENGNMAMERPEFALRTFRHGIAEGRLIGGNLSVLSALVGTPYAAEIRNRLVFLEDIGEAPYRIDRMLTQLQQSQDLNTAAGIMLGVFQKSNVPAGEASLTLDEVLDGHFAASKVPAVYGYSFGHIQHQFTIPVGIKARLDTRSQTLTLLEPAVLA